MTQSASHSVPTAHSVGELAEACGVSHRLVSSAAELRPSDAAAVRVRPTDDADIVVPQAGVCQPLGVYNQ